MTMRTRDDGEKSRTSPTTVPPMGGDLPPLPPLPMPWAIHPSGWGKPKAGCLPGWCSPRNCRTFTRPQEIKGRLSRRRDMDGYGYDQYISILSLLSLLSTSINHLWEAEVWDMGNGLCVASTIGDVGMWRPGSHSPLAPMEVLCSADWFIRVPL